MLPAKFRYSWPNGFREEESKLEAQWAEPMSLTFHSALRKRNTEPSIGAFHHISVHLAKQFQRRRYFRNRPIRNKSRQWRPYLFMERDEMSNRYRGPPIYAAYQFSVHLAKRFQMRRFLEIDQSETRIASGCHVC